MSNQFKIQKKSNYSTGYPRSGKHKKTTVMKRKLSIFSIFTIGFLFFILVGACTTQQELIGVMVLDEFQIVDDDVVEVSDLDVLETPDIDEDN